jgi:hypothetical protein
MKGKAQESTNNEPLTEQQIEAIAKEFAVEIRSQLPIGNLDRKIWPLVAAAIKRAHSERFIPDFETCVKQICAHLDQQGKTYVEIAIDPKTKEIGWSFTATLSEGGLHRHKIGLHSSS